MISSLNEVGRGEAICNNYETWAVAEYAIVQPAQFS